MPVWVLRASLVCELELALVRRANQKIEAPCMSHGSRQCSMRTVNDFIGHFDHGHDPMGGVCNPHKDVENDKVA